MSGGGNKTTQTQTSSASLMPSVQTGIDTALGGAKSLYDSGNVFPTYQGSTVVPFAGETRAGMGGIMNEAVNQRQQGGRNLAATFNLGTTGNGLNSGQQDALRSIMGIMSGAQGIGTGNRYNELSYNDAVRNAGQYEALFNDANGSNAETNLGKFASGAYLDGSNNPYFSKVVDRAAEGARNAVNMNFAGAGRYGSGSNQQVLAREVGDLTNRAYADQYNNEVANMFGANSQMDQQRLANLAARNTAAQGLSNVYAQNRNAQMSALGALTGVQGQNIANQMQAAGDTFNGYQQGMTNQMQARRDWGGQATAAMQPFQSMMGVGAMNEDLTSRQMNDDLRKWQGNADQPRLSAEWLAQLSSGAGGMGQTTTTRIQQPKTSPFMAGLGGAATGFGFGGPVGAAIGGGAGLLSSLF